MSEILELAKALAAFLAPALPYLFEIGEKAAEKAGEKLGSEVWQTATNLWRKLEPKVEARPAAAEAATDLARMPADADAQTVLRVQLRKLLTEDQGLATELRQLLGKAPAAVTGGLVAVGGDVWGDVIVMDPERIWHLLGEPRPGKDLSAATNRYLRHLVDFYRYLDFRGMGISDRVPLRLPLIEMYVPLRARIEMPEGETWARSVRLAGRAPAAEETEAMGQRLSEPQPVLELLRENDGLIILGDPGAGKTTFLKYLAVALAAGQGEALGLEKYLPVVLPLSAYATALETGDVPVERFIDEYYQGRGVELPIGEMLRRALEQGGTLLLFDGLDEVRDLGRRHLVVDRVKEFYCLHRGAGNKFVLTSRVVGYREVRPEAEGLGECTLVDFDDEEIEAFVGKWTAALEKAASGATQAAAVEAKREHRELLSAVRQNPGVRSLAANPLLLTILALMKRQGVTLPERRAELYQKYVETLLRHWNLARGLDRRSARELDLAETVRVLAPLALWMHKTSPGVGLVKEGDLHRELERIFDERKHEDPVRAAGAFLDDVRGHACLLLDRGGRQYGFIHLTFQEYLAAMALAQRGQQNVAPVVDELAAHVGEDPWHEVTLLTIGYLGIVQQ
ncbi:MAG: NACHT domain-containing protein, partial [bacterium]|nr:NACHT domain-containing protein [bacterium]